MKEQWRSEAKIVEGTKGEDLLPAVRASLAWDSCGNPEHRTDLVTSFTSSCFAPIGDQAGGNMIILKLWGVSHEDFNAASGGSNHYYIPDLCMSHSHVKIKSMPKDASRHQSRHLSLRNLTKVGSVVEDLRKGLRLQCSRIRRVVQSPPEQFQNVMKAFVRILFKYEHERQRKLLSSGKERKHLLLKD